MRLFLLKGSETNSSAKTTNFDSIYVTGDEMKSTVRTVNPATSILRIQLPKSSGQKKNSTKHSQQDQNMKINLFYGIQITNFSASFFRCRICTCLRIMKKTFYSPIACETPETANRHSI